MIKIKGTPAQGLIGATLGFFIGFAAVALFGPTAAAIKQTLGLTPLQVGFLVAMPSLSGSLLRIPFAAWVDTAGGRKPFLVLLCTSILGMIGSYLIWLGLLVLGTIAYAVAGRNAPYFQARAQGSDPEQAIEIGRQHGQEMFPSGKLKDSLVKSAQICKTWTLVAIYFTTFGGFIAMTSWLPTYWREY